MKGKKIGLLALTGLLATTVIAGCSSDSKEGGKGKQTTITFWDFPNFTSGDLKQGDYEKEMIKTFEAKNPDIKVNFELIDFTDGPAKLESAIASNTQPDVLFDAPGRIINWARQGYLEPLDDMFTTVKKTDFIPSVMEASSVDGKAYMYPQGSAPFTMAFNKTMLEKAGLMDLLPKLDGDRTWTTTQFETLLKEIKAKVPGVSPTSLYAKSAGGDQGTRAFISNLYGSWITNDDLTAYTINDANGVKALDWSVKAYKDGLLGVGVEALDSNGMLDLYRQQKTASTVLYSPGLYSQDKAKDLGFESVLVPFPNENGDPKLEFLAAGSCIFKQEGDDAAARVEASKKFIDFMANDETWGPKNLKATGNFSAKTSETGIYEDTELKYAESLSKYYGTYYNTISGFAEMRPNWFPTLQAALSGDKTPQAALDGFVKAADATIKK